jgi:prolyl-tRNA editing enzyme YbaK/EbsC (Cys-tRNA(Pro) deacylase)
MGSRSSIRSSDPFYDAGMELPNASQRLTAWAGDAGLDLDVHVFPEGTKTALDAAAAIGCEVAAIVKSLVFMVDGEAVVALVPGDLRLDATKLAMAAGGDRAGRASLDQVRDATGYAAGGTPPFGHGCRVFADPTLARNDPVWAAAGTPTTVFPISIDDLGRFSGATWVSIT